MDRPKKPPHPDFREGRLRGCGGRTSSYPPPSSPLLPVAAGGAVATIGTRAGLRDPAGCNPAEVCRILHRPAARERPPSTLMGVDRLLVILIIHADYFSMLFMVDIQFISPCRL